MELEDEIAAMIGASLAAEAEKTDVEGVTHHPREAGEVATGIGSAMSTGLEVETETGKETETETETGIGAETEGETEGETGAETEIGKEIGIEIETETASELKAEIAREIGSGFLTLIQTGREVELAAGNADEISGESVDGMRSKTGHRPIDPVKVTAIKKEIEIAILKNGMCRIIKPETRMTTASNVRSV
mmetsp:Transcript_23302/g.92783  ORF Transcript_23302/g.92783 Transcript_23302/m.92783 type:complete len:191 (+) Transcript_23302:2267-2839(+)